MQDPRNMDGTLCKLVFIATVISFEGFHGLFKCYMVQGGVLCRVCGCQAQGFNGVKGCMFEGLRVSRSGFCVGFALLWFCWGLDGFKDLGI